MQHHLLLEYQIREIISTVITMLQRLEYIHLSNRLITLQRYTHISMTKTSETDLHLEDRWRISHRLREELELVRELLGWRLLRRFCTILLTMKISNSSPLISITRIRRKKRGIFIGFVLPLLLISIQMNLFADCSSFRINDFLFNRTLIN